MPALSASASQSVTGLSTSGSYTFSIAASNRKGSSEQSSKSVAVTPYGRPKAVSSVSATATGANRMVKLNFEAPTANGSKITGYQYSTDGGGWNSFGGPGAVIDTGSNGTATSGADDTVTQTEVVSEVTDTLAPKTN